MHSTPIHAGLLATILASALAVSALPAAAKSATAAGRAEFAVRWSTADGGPLTAADALRRLGRKPHGKEDDFEVRYFDLATPADAPAGATALLRQRHTAKKAELTYKLRSATPLNGATGWRCLLPSPNESKAEADVSFLALDQVKTVHSLSCTFESADASLAPPAGLDATPKPCRSAMRRLKDGDLTAEAWSLAGGATLIEVSRKALDRPKDRQRFRDEVVRPLLAAGAVPLERSKSELGSDCR